MRDGDLIEGGITEKMLSWYDQNARDLPWRIQPGDNTIPDPYRIWLSEVMLQQTTVAAVRDYFYRFTTRWPTVADLAAAPDDQVMGEWAGLGYYARARNLLKCARVIARDHGGRFPCSYDKLITLPGIGPYTAAAIAAIAFGRPETVMDGNVERVMSRLFDVHTPLPAAKPELRAHAVGLTPALRAGDYAQAVMDLGATVCTPKSPACGLCPLLDECAARAAGTVSALPRKIQKKPIPTRRGKIYLVQREDGAMLLERRPENGLLGGMLGWPGSDWAETESDAPPIIADWRALPGEVRHTFTHFHLILQVNTASVPLDRKPQVGRFVPLHAFRASDLPTVMRKAFDLWRSE